MKKRIIFHIPEPLDNNPNSGSKIRPLSMISAFKSIGYEVDIISGNAKARKKKINEFKNKIKNGQNYDFLYSESSSSPTLLTEVHHFPMYPFLDFSFFNLCKKNKIKIGLFYRDIYWQFDEYKRNLSFIKRVVAKIFYYYDLLKYNKYLDVLFLPSERMSNYIPIKLNPKIIELPPAVSEFKELETTNYLDVNNQLEILYVGGIGEMYNIELLFSVISQIDNVKLYVCCRKDEWEKFNFRYSKYLCDNIEIIHKSGLDLVPYLKKVDVFSLFIDPIEYRTFAMPVKLFEYISYNKPIIASNNTAAGNFIEKHKIGWSIEYSFNELKSLLLQINFKRESLDILTQNIIDIKGDNTWKSRALKVSKVMSEL